MGELWIYRIIPSTLVRVVVFHYKGDNIMRNGRVETYLHSDNVTQNKGCATVCIVCNSDFAARTDLFVEYAKRMGMMVYACQYAYEDAVEEAKNKAHQRTKQWMKDQGLNPNIPYVGIREPDLEYEEIARPFPVRMLDIVEFEFPSMKEMRENLEKEIKETVQLHEYNIIQL